MIRLRILHLSSEKTWRGGEQQIAYLIEELVKHDTIIYVAAKSNSAFDIYCKKKGITVFSLPFKNGMDIRTALKINSICKEHNIDLVHIHSSKSHGIAVLSALLGNTTPFILSRRVAFDPKTNWLTRFKYNHKSIKKVICISNKVNEVMSAYLKDPSKCITVYSGIDLERFQHQYGSNILRQEFNIDAHWALIGNTSALDKQKDYVTFINVIKTLAEEGIKTKGFIIGDGPLRIELENYVNEIKLNEHIIFTGFRNNIPELLQCLDIFLMTTLQEGLGTSVLDAFASGVPVVATAVGGIPEMVIHEKTGLLAPSGDHLLMAKHVQRLIENDAFKKSLVQNAYQKVKEFSKTVTASKTLDVYREVLR